MADFLRQTCDSSSVMEPQMIQSLQCIVLRYIKAIEEDELEEFWQWLMPRREKQYPQCFMFPYQSEYQETYRRWQAVSLLFY